MNKVVLIGNGLSVGLNKDFALPNITQKFFNRLTSEHKSFIQHHMDRLKKGEYIQTDFEEAIASIEQAYESLKNYYDFLDENEQGERFMGTYRLEKNELEKHLKAIKEIIFEYTASILDLIDGHVRWKEINERLDGFVEWLRNIIEESTRIGFFTLNFDLLLETILLETIGTNNFMDYHVPRDKWELADNEKRFFFSPELTLSMFGEKKVELHHLHGSLSSFKDIDTGKTFKITTETLRSHNVYNKIFDYNIIPSIVTGGGKSAKVQEMPFNFYYNNFRRKLVDKNNPCDELYIIGYSFRDEHINNSICERLKLDRSKKDPKPLQRLLIVDFKNTEEEKNKFIDDINLALKLGPRTKGRFEYGDSRVMFEGANALSSVKF
ncbi:SIR2 family protein [Bacillus velezensis]|uniref:SIR2 family protein n=1 Tax=Bacillus TaxID=1386 RepID=UPI00195C9EA8|nr:SIR2 family protein [Bacillus velezensis]MED3333602.1 SIR2 family protein [Bacillus velezensis]MED3674983.1 SIR2 family protein [Bacillus velezensis]QRV10132.1 SIR2 family protein [Bacillus velezensis]WRT01571.1 SIR2 family protein [Bacillus velezensis]WRT09328.1 SIR2 family protein [Bacillus velezensis]